MKQLEDLSKEELINEYQHLQQIVNNLAQKNTQLTVTNSSLEVSNENLNKLLNETKGEDE